MAELCLQLLRGQMQLGISIRHSHAGIQFTERIQAGCPWSSWQVCRLQWAAEQLLGGVHLTSITRHSFGTVAKRPFHRGIFPWLPKSCPLQSYQCLSPVISIHMALTWAVLKNHRWGELRRAASSTHCLVTWVSLGSSVCAGPGLLLCERLSQCHSQTLLHHQTFAAEAKICLALGNGTRPRSSPKCYSNDGWNCFPSFSLLKLSQSCMFQQMLPCVGWNMLVEHNYIYLKLRHV